ncbi:hypothetical protein OIU74_024241 [Salix koriyanagi]|uniref:Uncharacterized protein n=1 Tax=Salix koriyanagi TaxID=2511006 RepID=A0A9Q1A7X5_9ROSI|nr:hypothetical protein OIU74_024241 [Salix koriyanagi]
MEGVPPSSMDDAVNQLEFETFNISELSWSPPEEVPVNQSSILCNDQAGQNRLVDNNDSIQQATQFPQTMMEVAPPSSVEDDVNFALNQLELETLLSGPPWSPQLPPHNLQLSGDHNQGQADQASVIPHIDNMQQESLVSQNFGRSTRSQMENLQVHVLQNQNARPNASDAGPDSSLQSQNRGLNTQQVRTLTELSPIANCLL